MEPLEDVFELLKQVLCGVFGDARGGGAGAERGQSGGGGGGRGKGPW